MNVNTADITLTSLETITAFDIVTGDFLFTLDELQSATISQTQDKNDITGKQGRKLNSIKRNKAVTISGDNGLISAGLMGMQSGSTFENKDTEVMWCEYLTVASNEATLTYKAIGATGSEIENLFVKNPDGTLGQKLTQAADTTTENTFTYTAADKKLAFKESELEDGTEIAVWYTRKIKGAVMSNYSDQYSQKCTLYMDAIGEDTCGNQYHVQFYIPKADFEGNWELQAGDNQTVHSFEAEALAGACGSAGKFFDFTIFGVNEEDVDP